MIISRYVAEEHFDVFISIMGALGRNQVQTGRRWSAHAEEMDAYVNVTRCLTATAAEVERDGQQSPV